MNKKGHHILYHATEKLRLLTGLDINILPTQVNGYDNRADAEIEIQSGDARVHFITNIKNEVRNFLPQKYLAGTEHLLVAQYIPKPLKQELKNLQYNYLDAAGNCFIRAGGLFIYINDQPVTEIRLPAEGKLWKAAGLKFIFAILLKQELLNLPYRKIAEDAGIALGNVGALLEELKKEGYLLGGHNGQFLAYKEKLIDRWAEAFKNTLRPKLMLGTFRYIKKDLNYNWEEHDAAGIKWGGENAGAILTNYLRPEKFTIYTLAPKAALMKKMQLVPDPNGNVELLEQFWKDDEAMNMEHRNTVPPILAYADLITNFDSRNRETAERIKQKYID
ncbi:type IV toxin-antitoxin system AbiEi family antitoxin [Mucilaginibacter pedocola]|uniref:Uncharacterized protein n=1 Tax=Mucilaginibacter pedocola TaxID=1792845 RepID=A0A1S9P7I7_9SPHI|nr:type IV toxin-antitoxin system AbiEi family antitoxin [Mucilaginibacter pedocola]OOQ56618.1 hypothetical protein BC343_19505 [Mucilaginibacter pedocola]